MPNDSSKYFISTFMGISYFNFFFLLSIIVTQLLYVLINFYITIYLTLNTNIVSFLLILIHQHLQELARSVPGSQYLNYIQYIHKQTIFPSFLPSIKYKKYHYIINQQKKNNLYNKKKIIMNTLLKHKTQSYPILKQSQKQQLQGWNNDIDQYNYSNNLLKILQKKITYPTLQQSSQYKKNNIKNKNKKIETLPAVIQYCRKQQNDKKIQQMQYKNNNNLHPLIHIQKNKYIQKQAIGKNQQNIQNILKKSKTQKNIQYVIQDKISAQRNNNNLNQNKNTEKIKIPSIKQIKQVKVCMPTFNRSHYQFAQTKKYNNDEYNQLFKRKIIRNNHKKIASVQSSYPQKKILTIQQPINIKQQPKNIKKIKLSRQYKQLTDQKNTQLWDHLNASEYKFKISNENYIRNIKQKKQKSIITQQKIKKHKELELNYTFFMQKILERNKFNNHKIIKEKNIKTQANYYFMDDHLQSPYMTKNQQLV